MNYEIFWASVKGSQNEQNNEDYRIVDKANNIYIIADGMSRNTQPAASSRIAATYLHSRLVNDFPIELDRNKHRQHLDCLKEALQDCNCLLASPSQAKETLQMARQYFNQLAGIHQFKGIDVEQFEKEWIAGLARISGMGTTLDCCVLEGDNAYVGHVGNGRVYLLNNKGFLKLTKEQVGHEKPVEMTEIEWTLKEMQLGLEGYIGKYDGFICDVFTVPLENGDILLMETDGLAHSVSEEEQKNALLKFNSARNDLLELAEHPHELAKAYAKKAHIKLSEAIARLGGRDNTTFIGIKKVE